MRTGPRMREVGRDQVADFPVVRDDTLARDSEGLQGEGVDVLLECGFDHSSYAALRSEGFEM